ncbi:MAG: D-alanine--D-alanine ligase [Myxococcota bacterium]
MEGEKDEAVILLFGGENAERFVSVASAQNLLRALPDASVRPWFWAPDGTIHLTDAEQLSKHQDPFTKPFEPASALSRPNLDAALADQAGTPITLLPALHGIGVEDGKLQRVLEERGIAFTGSGSAASALAFNKVQAKARVQSHGIATTPVLLAEGTDLVKARREMSDWLNHYGALVMKPTADGSSFGLHFVNTDKDVETALAALRKDPRTYMVEPKLHGTELAVGVIEHDGRLQALPCTQVKLASDRCFDYAGKYLGDGVEEITPAQVDESIARAARRMALQAHKALGCRGYSRTDLIAAAQGLVFLELNTLPGLSERSFIPQQLAAAGVSMREFVREQLSIARASALSQHGFAATLMQKR